jgi:hypothetical protein
LERGKEVSFENRSVKFKNQVSLAETYASGYRAANDASGQKNPHIEGSSKWLNWNRGFEACANNPRSKFYD